MKGSHTHIRKTYGDTNETACGLIIGGLHTGMLRIASFKVLATCPGCKKAVIKQCGDQVPPGLTEAEQGTPS